MEKKNQPKKTTNNTALPAYVNGLHSFLDADTNNFMGVPKKNSYIC